MFRCLKKSLNDRLYKAMGAAHRKMYGAGIGLLGSFSMISATSCAGSCSACGSCGATVLIATGIILSNAIGNKKDKKDA